MPVSETTQIAVSEKMEKIYGSRVCKNEQKFLGNSDQFEALSEL